MRVEGFGRSLPTNVTRRALRALAALSIGIMSFGVLGRAEAKPSGRADWKRIDVPAGPDADRLGRELKAALSQATRQADFGKGAKPTLSARLVEFRAAEQGDVLRLSCVLVGRVEGGQGARSRISFGGRPTERAKLERQVLTMVANGVVTRLAAIARTRSSARAEHRLDR